MVASNAGAADTFCVSSRWVFWQQTMSHSIHSFCALFPCTFGCVDNRCVWSQGCLWYLVGLGVSMVLRRRVQFRFDVEGTNFQSSTFSMFS